MRGYAVDAKAYAQSRPIVNQAFAGLDEAGGYRTLQVCYARS
jgi:hypothetical protein